jgi:hypothetical protein
MDQEFFNPRSWYAMTMVHSGKGPPGNSFAPPGSDRRRDGCHESAGASDERSRPQLLNSRRHQR